MKELMESVIVAGNYKLADIQRKIKKMYVLGDLSEAEADELLTMAVSGVSPDAERPEILQMIQTLAAEVKALAERVNILQGGMESGKEKYPIWKPWDGISMDYQHGSVVTHNNKLWESVYDGQNVWEPGTAGTESMWKTFM